MEVKTKLIIPVLMVLTSILAAQTIQEQIQSLRNDFKNFQYEMVIKKGQFLLAEPTVSKKDSLVIYEYMLNAAYALNVTVYAKRIAHDILETSPEFVPNPETTSPKITRFFEKVRAEFLQAQKPVEKTDSSQTIVDLPTIPVTPVLASVLFPGSGHLLTGKKKKGLIFNGLSAGLLAGITVFAIKTNHYEDDYLSAGPGSDFDMLYDRYNRSFRARNILLATYAVYNLYVLYDLLNGFRQNHKVNIQLGVSSEKTVLTFSIYR